MFYKSVIANQLQILVNGPMESVLQRVTIIGEILSFRSLLHTALNDVLKRRLPFLLSIVNDLRNTANEHNLLVISCNLKQKSLLIKT